MLWLLFIEASESHFWKYMGRNKHAFKHVLKLICLCLSIRNFVSISAFHTYKCEIFESGIWVLLGFSKIRLFACHISILSPKQIKQPSKICCLIYMRHGFSGARGMLSRNAPATVTAERCAHTRQPVAGWNGWPIICRGRESANGDSMFCFLLLRGWEEREVMWQQGRHLERRPAESQAPRGDGGCLRGAVAGRWLSALCHPPGSRDSSSTGGLSSQALSMQLQKFLHSDVASNHPVTT